jgi:DNA-binding transcriptional ArsR family regulator
MDEPRKAPGLHFACECISILQGYSDPWAAIAQKRLLNDGTKERILNAVAPQPKTIANLAAELALSQPAVHRHVTDMLRSELLREAVEWEKKHPAENYYEPNFPVVRSRERAVLEPICTAIAERFAELFALEEPELRQALERSGIIDGGRTFDVLAQYCYAQAQRGARRLLEQRGILPPPEKHCNGANWLFWAEEPNG